MLARSARTILWGGAVSPRQHGEDGLRRHPHFKATKELRLQIVSEHLIEFVSLTELSAKYLLARSAIMRWCKVAREQGKRNQKR